MDDLDKMFDDFETKNQTKKEKEEKKKQNQERLREEFLKQIDILVLPTFKEFKKKIDERGYSIKIEELLEKELSFPSATILFTPHKNKNKTSFFIPSKFIVSLSHDYRVQIKSEVRGNNRAQHKNIDQLIKIDEIDNEFLKEKVKEFIKAVLASV